MEQKNSNELTAPSPDDFKIGQRVIVAKRGPATVISRVLPQIWAVDFIGLEGFGYVFADEMKALSNETSETTPMTATVEDQPKVKILAA